MTEIRNNYIYTEIAQHTITALVIHTITHTQYGLMSAYICCCLHSYGSSAFLYSLQWPVVVAHIPSEKHQCFYTKGERTHITAIIKSVNSFELIRAFWHWVKIKGHIVSEALHNICQLVIAVLFGLLYYFVLHSSPKRNSIISVWGWYNTVLLTI